MEQGGSARNARDAEQARPKLQRHCDTDTDTCNHKYTNQYTTKDNNHDARTYQNTYKHNDNNKDQHNDTTKYNNIDKQYIYQSMYK